MQRLYRIWQAQLTDISPCGCGSRIVNLAWLIGGMYLAKSVHLTHIACKIPMRVQKLSLERRLRRLVDNAAIRVRQWYAPVMKALLAGAGSGGEIRLIIDTTKIGSGHRLLMVAVAYRRRALPIAWTWVRHHRGHSTTRKQVKLLSYVRRFIPAGCAVSLVGDGEFSSTLLLEYLDNWGWTYALRQAKDHLVMVYGTTHWQRLDELPVRRGHRYWWGRLVLTRASSYPTRLVAYWQTGHDQPLYLATNCLLPEQAIRLYRRRMWIEEMFGDMKKHGVDLEATRLRHFLRLSRLTLAACLLYVWLVSLGDSVQREQRAAWVDRSDRRDLSIFRLGWDFLDRCLTLNDTIPKSFIPSFSLVSGC